MPILRLEGALFSLAQERLELGEHLLDGIEVGRIGRKEQEARAGRPDCFADLPRMLASASNTQLESDRH